MSCMCVSKLHTYINIELYSMYIAQACLTVLISFYFFFYFSKTNQNISSKRKAISTLCDR